MKKQQADDDILQARDRVSELKELVRRLDFDLISQSRDLHELCFANDLHDRAVVILLSHTAAQSNEQRLQLEEKQKKHLMSLVMDLKFYCRDA